MNRKLIGNSRKRVLALSLGLTLTGCNFFQETTDIEHVAKAKAFLDKNDYRSGSIELKSALQKNPDNAEARRLLGEISVVFEDGEAGEKELRKAMELGVAREAVVLHLAEALQLQGKSQKILSEINALPSLDAKDRAALMAYRGNAWLALNKPDEARAEYEQALAIDDRSALTKLGLASLAIASKDLDKAKLLVTEALEAEPNLGKIWSFKAELENAKREFEQAEASYGKAIELRQKNYSDRANRALVRVALKKMDSAKEDVEVLKKDAPKYFLGHYANGVIKLIDKKYTEAQAAFEESLRLNDRYALTLYFLAVCHIYQNHLEQADAALARFLAMVPGSVKGNQVMALVKFRQKDFAAARKFLTPVTQYLPKDVFTLKLMANIEFALGNSDQGIEYLQKVAELDPDSPLTKAQLGLGLLGVGETEKGLEALETAVELDPNLTQATIYIALTQIRTKQFDKAQESIEKLKQKMPDKALPINLEGMAYFAKGDVKSSKEAFEKALAIAPSDLTASMNLAQLAIREKDFAKARELIQKRVQDHPDYEPAYLALAELSAIEGKPADMESALRKAIEVNPKSLQPRIVLSRLYIRVGQAAKAITLLEEVKGDHAQNPDFLAALIEAQLENNLVSQALINANALVNVSPDKPLSHYLLARAYAENGDGKGLRASLEKSLQLDPKFFRSRQAMVKLLSQDKKPAEAQKILNELSKEFPDHPEVLGLNGWFAMQQRRPQEAVEAYKLALDKAPSSSFAVSLARAQAAAGDKISALKTLEIWNDKNPEDAYVRYVRSGILKSMGRTEEAKMQLSAILESQPNNALALNDLAWMLKKDDPAKALEYAEQAVSLAPKAAGILDTLAIILLDKGQSERALSLLEQSYAYARKNPAIRYHLALAYAKNGRNRDASAVLKELLNENVRFEERKEAENFAKQLIQK
jgi:putative PEP-CTERM system TPR-repeat lipoprotein